jgi:Sir2 family
MPKTTTKKTTGKAKATAVARDHDTTPEQERSSSQQRRRTKISQQPKIGMSPPFHWHLPAAEENGVMDVATGWQSVVDLLRTKRKIVVLTGAGISVSCGIPDFRSKDHGGLYHTLDAQVRVVS